MSLSLSALLIDIFIYFYVSRHGHRLTEARSIIERELRRSDLLPDDSRARPLLVDNADHSGREYQLGQVIANQHTSFQ